jgi:hypothetical protein
VNSTRGVVFCRQLKRWGRLHRARPSRPARLDLTALHEPSVDMIEVWDEEPSVDMVEVWDEEPCRVPGSRSPTPPRGGDVGRQRLLLGA